MFARLSENEVTLRLCHHDVGLVACRIKKCGSNSKTIAIVWRCRYCLKRKFWNNSLRTYINGRLIHEGESNLPIITEAGNLNIRRGRSMSNQTRGRRLVLHFDGVSGYSGRDGQGSKCRFILLWFMTGERSRSLCMNFESLTREFLLVKTSFPMGFAVGSNFENSVPWSMNK